MALSIAFPKLVPPFGETVKGKEYPLGISKCEIIVGSGFELNVKAVKTSDV